MYYNIEIMSHYDPLKIEEKWQKRWEDEQAFVAKDDDPRPKKYLAEMFPYPSGAGSASYPPLPDACSDIGVSRCLR